MADAVERPWEQEDIPDVDVVYMRVHRDWVDDNGNPSVGVFKDQGGGMSTDWQRYATPHETRIRSERQGPENYGVIALVVDRIRGEVPGQQVVHTPDFERNNRAHTDVIGDKDKKRNPEARVKLRRIAQWVIEIDDPVV